jgi:exportin-1
LLLVSLLSCARFARPPPSTPPPLSPQPPLLFRYWHILTADLYESECKLALTPANPLSLGNGGSRKHQYAVILTGVRQVMISRMAKPEEVLVVEDENGDVVRETTKDTEQLAQYKTMKECLVYAPPRERSKRKRS